MSRACPRDLFPLPVPASSDPPRTSVSRKVRRRSEVHRQSASLVSEVVSVLNQLHGQHGLDSGQTVSAAQKACLEHIHRAVLRFGKPPVDLTSAGALRELRVNPGYSVTSSPVVPISEANINRVALPPVGWSPAGILQLGGSVGEAIVDELHALRRPDPALTDTSTPPPRIYHDPYLRSHPRLYARFLLRLSQSNLVTWRRACTSCVGVFFVAKKNGDLRLILDGRQAGEHFDEPPHVDLATGSAFSALEVDGGGPIYVGETDIENAFYGIQLPPEFW